MTIYERIPKSFISFPSNSQSVSITKLSVKFQLRIFVHLVGRQAGIQQSYFSPIFSTENYNYDQHIISLNAIILTNTNLPIKHTP
jgi:hypothetical protein